jgi:SAM-dependent MidA family methyltransferase
VARIRDEILAAPDQRLTFARFMELALYEPGLGYYRRHDDRATRSGDFLTAPEMDPIFASALAAQLEEMWQRLGRPEAFTLRDHGAGTGRLGDDLRAALEASGSALVEGFRYEPVEIGPERLPAESVDPQRPFIGCLLANELVDALPVHRLEAGDDGELHEIGVGWHDGWFVDTPMAISDGAQAALDSSGVRPGAGQRIDVRPAAGSWLRAATAPLERGWAVLIDYGASAAELLRRMPEGTVRTYRRHHAGDDPFLAVGATDLTAHVDFQALERSAAEAGLDSLGRTSLAEFLAGLEIGERLVELRGTPGTTAERYLTARSAVLRLLDPRQLGGFGVLVLGRGVPAAPPLRGLSFRLERAGRREATA